ncbi:hypothetical protein EC957_003768 [Mortierella hygrophila]|uniref:Uncharacterized protein n=1 Tax=Mortierella hygrophila TaxID=979708 RepID=A0A9P6K083_9FUNG|nr:hypothetical protein EC957_003768 [Mortierella hygrophila]
MMKIITFSLFVLVAVASIALAHPTLNHSSAPSFIEAEPVLAAAAPAPAAPDAVETPQGHIDKRNYRKQTTAAEAPEATYPAELWPKYKRKRDHNDITETELANSPDITNIWDVIERRADKNGTISTPTHTPEPLKSKTTTKPKPKPETRSKVKTRTKQPPVKLTRAPKSPPRPNLPPSVPALSSAPSPTPPSAPAPGPGSAEPNPPSKPQTGSAMISNNAQIVENCRSVTLTWKIFIDKSEVNLRWRHEISYFIDRGSSDSLIFLGGNVVQDEKTKVISESNEQSIYFSPDGGFGVRISPVGQGTAIVWFWKSQTREFSKPSAIVPYSGDDMKYGYDYWDCIPPSW